MEIDLTNQKFGKLTVIKFSHQHPKYKTRLWLCKCDCGNLKNVFVSTSGLRRHEVESCGCLRSINHRCSKNELIDKRFGKLVVVSLYSLASHSSRGKWWNCKCDCGNNKIACTTDLNAGSVKSCGCLRKRRGKDNPLYNGKQKRTPNAEAQEWRNAIFKRDNWTCQLCWKYGDKLQAHHLNNWAQFPNERLDLNNGITLCEECHRAFHKAYGLKVTKNTLQQCKDDWWLD